MNARREGVLALAVVHTTLAVFGAMGVLGGAAVLVLASLVDRIPTRMRLHGTAESWAQTEVLAVVGAMCLAAISTGLCVAIARGLRRQKGWAHPLGSAHAVVLMLATLGALPLLESISWVGAGVGLLVPAAVLALLLGPLRRSASPAPASTIGADADTISDDPAARPDRPSSHWPMIAVVVGLSSALLVAGHQLFLFICDDAFIAFRYVSNSQLGHGYVWNAAPFAPVEGYTSFAWVALMDALWTLTGLDPTVTSNPVSLFFAFVATAIVGVWAYKMPLTGGLARARVGVVAAVLLGTVTNRTWLTWSTSGLETAMFNAALLAWIAVVAMRPRTATLWALWILAAALTLTRPDGLLFLAATSAAWVLWLVHRRRSATLLDVFSPLPAAAPVAHLFWRHATYGLWLPNTYYAKHVSMWPESGLAYVTTFLLEYGGWLPLALVLVAAWRWRRALQLPWLPRSPLALLRLGLAFTVVFHWGYYTLNVGGDHFEFRIYTHWVPLALIGGAWALDRLLTTRVVASSALAVTVCIGLVLPWSHWSMSSQLTERRDTRKMVVELTPHSPLPLRGYTLVYDLLQHYMQNGHVGTRHQEHLVFVLRQQGIYPTREQGLKISADDLPVHAAFSVGVPAWTLPHVAIIDKLGLNDLVVARNPTHGRSKTMGHDRRPPKGYVECLKPNTTARGGRATVRPRTLTARQVHDCETRYLEIVKKAAK